MCPVYQPSNIAVGVAKPRIEYNLDRYPLTQRRQFELAQNPLSLVALHSDEAVMLGIAQL